MRILITNDDGIGAPGIRRLAEMAASLGEVWVVAPENQCSAMSHRITIRGQMTARRVDFPVPAASAWSLAGTPADCVKVALMYLMRDHRPDMVFSGVNHGYNAGYDIAYSGTVGACMEAVQNGIPAMAFSAKGNASMDVAARHMPAVMRELLELGQGPGEIWNVNFPEREPLGILRGRAVAPMQLYRGVYTSRQHPEGHRMLGQTGVPVAAGAAPDGTDIAAVLDGYLSLGKIKSPVMA
jgi:5'-nucleotidase